MKTKVLLVCVLALAACATAPNALDEARKLAASGRGEEALMRLEQALKENPTDHGLRRDYFRHREVLTAQWLSQAETLRLAGQLENAETLYRRVLKHDPGNTRATAGLEQVATDRRHLDIVAAVDKLIRTERYREAEDMLRPVLAENPQQRDARRLQRVIDEKLAKPAVAPVRLRPTKPITLELRDVPLRAVFEVLQRATGVTFVFDRDVRTDQRTSIAVRDASLEEAIRLTLLANALEQKVLNQHTVFVYPNTPAKLREHQELVVKAFYIANADVKQTANMIRTLVRTRDIFIDEKINLLVLKDTPHAVQLAERLVAAQDLAEPEVMLEVEVLEVSTTKLLELGLRWPDSLGISLVGSADTPGTLTLREARHLNSDLVRLTVTDPFFLLSLRQQDDHTQVLANPRIRVKNREKARVHIGDRVPVITTTAAATGGFVSESVTYLDVGLKLEVEPLIYLEDEVGIKVALEVSNIAREVRGATSNTLTYQIGTRNAATNLRLRDGETQILAGLINDEDRRSAARVPGLGEMPLLGRLFSHTRDNTARSEVMLLITPRLMRTLARPDVRSIEFAAGTEAATGTRPGALPPIITPPVIPAPAPAPAPVQPPPTSEEPKPGVPTAPVTPPSIVPFGGVKPPSQ